MLPLVHFVRFCSNRIIPARQVTLAVIIPAIVVVVTLVAAGSAHAQLPTARLNTVFPPGGKAGDTIEVTIAGNDLDEVNELRFSHTNITVKPKLKEGGDAPESNKFVLTIPGSVPVGLYDVRAVGRFGISNPRAFVVGDLPELLSSTTNNTVAGAMDVPIGTVVNGRAEANAVDHFRFGAKKGQRVLIECVTEEIDSRMDDTMVLQDASGKELERARRGGLLDFTAHTDGEFVLKLHDFTYRGGDEYFYRLTVSTRPHIDFVLPPAGAPGTKQKFTLYGRNLPNSSRANEIAADGKPLETLEMELEVPAKESVPANAAALKPSGVAVDTFEYRLATEHGVSHPVQVGLATAPVTLEAEPNTAPDQAQKITLPCEYTGRFYPRDDRDWITFDAKKGDVYWLEVFSHRLALPTDPFILVQRVTKNGKGVAQASDVQEFQDSENVGGVEFNTASRDPVGRFEVKEDGVYRALVRDLFNRSRDNPALVYRLSLCKEEPDFRLVVLPLAPLPADANTRPGIPWTPLLRRHETQPIKVLALRRDGFKEEIQLTVEGLPPDVIAAPATIEAGKNVAILTLTAADDAKSWAGNINISGRATIGGAEVTRQARGGTVMWHVPDYNNEPVLARATQGFAIAVCGAEKAALSIEAVETNVFEAAAGEKVQIPIRVNRHSEFMNAVKLKAVGESALDSLPELEVATKTNVATLEVDLAKIKLGPGTHTFSLRTQTAGNYRSYAAEAQAAEGDASRAGQAATAAAMEAKKAAEALAAAMKALTEAETQAASASDADKDALTAKVQEAAEAKAAAEKASNEAAASAQAAEKRKAETKARFEDLKKKSAGKAANITVYSAPITLRVKPEEKK